MKLKVNLVMKKKLKRMLKKNKLTRYDFEDMTNIKHTDSGLFLQTKTDICKYGQAYIDGETEEEAMENYLDHYYPMYLKDYKSK